jgi:hypothetical protein
MICNTDKEKRLGMTEELNTLDNFTKERKMGKGDFNGKTVATMKVTLSMVNFKASVFITFQISIKLTKASLE